MTTEQEMMIREAIDTLDSGACTCRALPSESGMGDCPACQAVSLLYSVIEEPATD